MITDHTPESLRAFETDVAAAFNAGRIRAPIHLDGGNEEALVRIFEGIKRQDWVCCSWRSHYKCLLKGVPPADVMDAILAGRSISLCFPEYRIISSAIVGGILPIALGIASAIDRDADEWVWAFVGDMTAMTGIYAECKRYAIGHDLPITFIVEDNGKSVCTDTRSVWGNMDEDSLVTVEKRFRYHLPFPHSGAGIRVNF